MFFSCHPSICQDLKTVVQDNSHEISINPEDSSFEDLVYLKDAIKNARVVILGEQDHGDGTTFLAKTRLVKFLHEKLGYNVLAFESDFISLDLAWAQLKDKKLSVKEAINRNVYPVWTKCLQCNGLFKYIEVQSVGLNPLNITGFDGQITGVTAYWNLKKLLLDSIAHLTPLFFKTQKTYITNQIDTAIDLLGGGAKLKVEKPKEFYESFIKSLSIIEDNLTRGYPENKSFTIFIKSIKSFHVQMLHYLNGERLISGQERDQQMAQNLTWLMQEKYAKEKIIVWAANSHIIKNYQAEINKKYNAPFSMGQILTRNPEVANQVYIIGFTGYTGTSKRAFGSERVFKITSPKKNSLESWINETKKENVFIDFIKLRSDDKYRNETFYMNFKNWFDEKSAWLNSYDGMIYINNISPCETSEGLE